jgi:hypothetical protein
VDVGVKVCGDGVQLARDDCQAQEAGDGLEADAAMVRLLRTYHAWPGSLGPVLGADPCPCNFVGELP